MIQQTAGAAGWGLVEAETTQAVEGDAIKPEEQEPSHDYEDGPKLAALPYSMIRSPLVLGISLEELHRSRSVAALVPSTIVSLSISSSRRVYLRGQGERKRGRALPNKAGLRNNGVRHGMARRSKPRA